MLLATTVAWGGVCSNTADTLLKACKLDIGDNSLVATAACQNLTDADARKECLAEVKSTSMDDTSNCYDVHQARLDVCDAVGQGPYDPHFGPDYKDNFVNPLKIGTWVAANPHFPLLQGSKWKYLTTYKDENGESITEKATVTVTKRTKLIEGITCVVVTDVVLSSDGTVEYTEDWYTQDVKGNVWYCGEISQEQETFEGDKPSIPELVGIDGSWKTGREGAKAGIVMLAWPAVGKSYRQELLWVEAEDVAKVLALDANESVSGGAFRCKHACVKTRDYTALEPDANEHKYYAPGVGLILEVNLASGARNELVSYTHP
jgi:hypothetical protein